MSKLSDFENLSRAEQRFIRDCPRGVRTIVNEGHLPAGVSSNTRIRAALIRHFALGGCDAARPTEKGVEITGAWIEGPLELEGAAVAVSLGLYTCHFSDRLNLLAAVVPGLYLDRCHLSDGLRADRLRNKGSLHLRGARVFGEVRLPDAEISGNLDCKGASLSNKADNALTGDGMKIGGNVIFRDAAVDGEIRMLGAGIEGDLSCSGARLRNEGGYALAAEGSAIKGTFFLRQGAKIDGRVGLIGASIGHINDDAACWPDPGMLRLNRCLYGAFTGGPVDADSRLKWLARQHADIDAAVEFQPQPYEHLAKVLKEMGHTDDTGQVLLKKEFLQRRARTNLLRRRLDEAKDLHGADLDTWEYRRTAELRKISSRELSNRAAREGAPDPKTKERWFAEAQDEIETRLAQHRDARAIADARLGAIGAGASHATDQRLASRWGVWTARRDYWLHVVWSLMLHRLTGYGYRPVRALGWGLLLIAFGTMLYGAAYRHGDFAPSPAPILVSDGWLEVIEANPGEWVNHAEIWSADGMPGQDYETFNALAYAADLVIPLINFGQDDAWAPSTTRSWWGWHGWWLRWVLKIFGWVLTGVAAASVATLVRRD